MFISIMAVFFKLNCFLLLLKQWLRMLYHCLNIYLKCIKLPLFSLIVDSPYLSLLIEIFIQWEIKPGLQCKLKKRCCLKNYELGGKERERESQRDERQRKEWGKGRRHNYIKILYMKYILNLFSLNKYCINVNKVKCQMVKHKIFLI